MLFEVVMSGSGGQGILFMGNLLAQAALREGRHVTFLPTYGAAMRGGTANCVVKVAAEEVASPVMHRPHAAIVLNQQSLNKFGPAVRAGGFIIANSSAIDIAGFSRDDDVRIVPVPATDIAREVAKTDRAANMVMLAAFLSLEPLVQSASIETILSASSSLSPDVIQRNVAAFRAGLPKHFAAVTVPKPAAPAAAAEMPETASPVIVEAPADAVAAEGAVEAPVFDVDGYVAPWIDSEKCSTCEECVNINPNMFAYDHRKKAYIKDPNAGPYKHLVRAAEKCSEKVIHPGYPADRSEKGIARLIEKARKFMQTGGAR